MKYDSKQLSLEIASLSQNKELAFQQYHKICGALEMLTAMLKTALEDEREIEKVKPKNAKVTPPLQEDDGSATVIKKPMKRNKKSLEVPEKIVGLSKD